ncbi:MAG: UPF0280 family protein [Thermodesulfobacteriota bacterium]
MGQPRLYREISQNARLAGYRVCVRETDLWVQTRLPCEARVRELIFTYRGYIESYIAAHPGFADTLVPWPLKGPAPEIIRDMTDAAAAAGVGPMAAVAGAVAEQVGKALLADCPEVMIENGGDIFVKLDEPFTLAVDAGASPLSYKIGLQLDAAAKPLGVCTSSGSIGHSLSYGRADAVCVVSDACALADAAATAIGNRMGGPEDIDAAVAFGKTIPGVSAIVIIVGDRIGLWGELSVVPVNQG